MGRHKRIAAVTAAIQSIVADALTDAVPGATARLGLLRPPEPGSAEAWIHLHRLAASAAGRNLPPGRADGTAPEGAAMDLHYLIAFTAEEPLATELMLEKVLAAIDSMPVLTAAEIERRARNFPALAGNDLALQTEPIRLTLSYPPGDKVEMWTGLQPSLHVTASPVLIEREAPPSPALSRPDRIP